MSKQEGSGGPNPLEVAYWSNSTDLQQFLESHDNIVRNLHRAPTAEKAAAIWWASAVRKPSVESGSADMLDLMLLDNLPVTNLESGALSRFADLLEVGFKSMLNKRTNDEDFDYDPRWEYYRLNIDNAATSAVMLDAAKKSEIGLVATQWPRKSEMWISDNVFAARLDAAPQSRVQVFWGDFTETAKANFGNYATFYPEWYNPETSG